MQKGCSSFTGSSRSLTYGHVIEDARRLGATLQNCSFHHVFREGNLLAHSLARKAVLTADIDVWVEELPSDLDDVFRKNL